MDLFNNSIVLFYSVSEKAVPGSISIDRKVNILAIKGPTNINKKNCHWLFYFIEM